MVYKFLQGLINKYDIQDCGLAMIIKQRQKENEIERII